MARKRPNGEGYLRKRKNGLWECTIMIGYHPDGRRKYKSFYGRTQKEAKEKLHKYQETLAHGLKLDDNLTFAEWANTWYESYEGQVADSTYQNYRYTLRILKNEFGTMKVHEIKALHIEQFLKKQAQMGKPQSSLAKLRGMLFQIFKKAIANDLIIKNPVECADNIKAIVTPEEKQVFSECEIEHMMKHLPHDRIGHSIRLMLGTGIRTQELLALQQKHIAEDCSSLLIEQAIKLVNGTPELGTPKSKTSYRTIPVLLSIRESAIFLRNTDTPFIWSNQQTGRFCNPSSFRKQFKSALQELGEVQILSPHCCRHTYVSQLQAAGVPLETIQALTGHASIDMTEHYLHVQDKVKEQAIERLDSILTSQAA